MKRVLEVDFLTVWTYLTLTNYTLTDDWDGKFYVMCILSQLIFLIQIKIKWESVSYRVSECRIPEIFLNSTKDRHATLQDCYKD